MYTLLLDSSNKELAIGLCKESIVLASTIYEAWQEQSEYMIPEIEKLLNAFNVKKEEIDDVVVSIGPGSYTGVRIAITIAKIIGYSLNVPVYPISTLQVLEKEDKTSICVLDARSGRSYFGVYKREKTIVGDKILSNDEVIEYINSHPECVVCGDARYLGLEGYKANVIDSMCFLKKYLTPIDNIHKLKPVYLKD